MLSQAIILVFFITIGIYWSNANAQEILDCNEIADIEFNINPIFDESYIESGWLQSVGVGARFFSTHSRERQVIHVDIAHPLSNNPDLNRIELRITTKHSF